MKNMLKKCTVLICFMFLFLGINSNVIASPVSLQGMTPALAEVYVGDSTSFNTTATGGTSLLYQYHVYNYQTKIWTVATDYTASPSLDWTFKDAGKYQVMCFVKDGSSSNQYDSVAYSEVKAAIYPVILEGITPSQLTATTGKQENITVIASGGTSLLYQYHVYNYQTKVWTVATDYITNPSLSWTFKDSGKYQVMCFVKDQTSANQYDKVAYCEVAANAVPINLEGITPSQLTTTTGKQETIKVNASGGTSLLYQYHVYNYQTKVWTVATNYSANPSLNWTFKDSGKYQVMCFVKDQTSSNQYDKVAYCEVAANSVPINLEGITPSQLTTTTGKQETIKVNASGGTSLLYQYHLYNYQTKVWTVATDYTANPSLSWTFKDSGKYQVMCFVKDQTSANQYDKVAYCEVTANAVAITLNGITPSQLTTNTGKQETITVSASGGSGLLYQYHVYNYQTKVWTAATNYTTNPSLGWTFRDAGKYQVMCFVKDQTSGNQYDKVAYCEVTANAVPIALIGITPSQLMTTTGKQEAVTVSASGGTSLLYQYHIYNYQTKLWSMVQNYSTNPTLKWTFNEIGSYQIMCFVKDINSSKPYDAVAYCEAEAAIPVGAYNDGNIKINVEKFRQYGSNIYVADIQISEAYMLKTAFANNTFGPGIIAKTSEMAKAHNAILAVNGDYCAYKNFETGGIRSSGYVLRNGAVYRDTSTGSSDLVINSAGDFSVISEAENSMEALVNMGAWQILSFGPGLVENGTISIESGGAYGVEPHPRTAIGQISKLHYIFIVSDGRSSENKGLTFAEIAKEFKERGCTTAYNLDGGGSSTMYFQGKVINNPAEGLVVGEREISDIVYFGY